jgi:hypothetical protein
MFCSCSWLFSLLPSCLPIVPLGTIQVAGNLSYYWGPKVGPPWGIRSEHILGHLECPQGRVVLITLELPALYIAALHF